MSRFAALLLVLVSMTGSAQSPNCSLCAIWNAPQTPFRIFANTYYVGPHGLSSILITSPSGHILIDGALPESAALIAANIRALGFKMQDIKLILNSHVHFDHAGGIAGLQRLTGATVLADPWSAAVLSNGGIGRGDPQFGIINGIPPVRRVRILRPSQLVRLGPLVIASHPASGHTPGGTTWTWQSCEAGHCLNLVYANSMTPVSADNFRYSTNPDYRTGFSDLTEGIGFVDSAPCDILLTAHPDASNFWNRIDSHNRHNVPDLLFDPHLCHTFAQSAREQLLKRMAAEASSR